MHLPHHNYAGPGTNVSAKLDLGILPTTYLDAAALIHDVEYSFYPNQKLADANMLKNLSEWSGVTQLITKIAFTVKDIFGYTTKTTTSDEYLRMHRQARKMLDSTPYKKMKFIDER